MVVTTAMLHARGRSPGWVLLQMLVLGGLAQARAQQVLYAELREQLAAQTAPTGGAHRRRATPVALLAIPTLGLRAGRRRGHRVGRPPGRPGPPPRHGAARSGRHRRSSTARAATYGAPVPLGRPAARGRRHHRDDRAGRVRLPGRRRAPRRATRCRPRSTRARRRLDPRHGGGPTAARGDRAGPHRVRRRHARRRGRHRSRRAPRGRAGRPRRPSPATPACCRCSRSPAGAARRASLATVLALRRLPGRAVWVLAAPVLVALAWRRPTPPCAAAQPALSLDGVAARPAVDVLGAVPRSPDAGGRFARVGSVCGGPGPGPSTTHEGLSPMKRSKVSILRRAPLLAGVLAASIAGPGCGGPDARSRKDIVGVGSDTSQFARQLPRRRRHASAARSPRLQRRAAGARLVSFDARTRRPRPSSSRPGTAAITRPNGSGAGKALLYGAGNNPNVNFARSSSGPQRRRERRPACGTCPFAVDGLKLATATTLERARVASRRPRWSSIYNGTVTNWNQIGGANGVIVPMIPQTGSGTRTLLHRPAQGRQRRRRRHPGRHRRRGPGARRRPDRRQTRTRSRRSPPVGSRTATGIKLVTGAGSFVAQRALYNVVRGADLTKPWFTAIFGADGFVCSGRRQPLIEAVRLRAARDAPLDGGVCGVPTQAATTNFTVAT